MRGVETRIQEIRHAIFTEVAKMAYDTEIPEANTVEEIPYHIIPGETGNFRSDVFLERAIVGERVRLARAAWHILVWKSAQKVPSHWTGQMADPLLTRKNV